MRFNRIDENSIRCIITQAEMDEHGIHIDDLMDDREKAETFLRYILQQANEEMDFNISGNAVNVQLSVMPGGDVSLMISDNEKSALKNMLAEFKRSLQNFREILDERRNTLTDVNSVLQEMKELMASGQLPALSNNEGSGIDDILEIKVVAEFDSLEQLIRMAKTVTKLHDRPSCLMKHNNIYYLLIDLEDTRQNIADMSFDMTEYSRTLYAESENVYDIKEHGATIIPEDAINILSEM